MRECLLVEKNAEERNRLASILSGLGFACDSVADSQQALNFCRTRKPALVMMEANALDDAKDLLRATRETARGAGPIIILYAAQPGIAAMGETILEGAAEFLLKPFDSDLLAFKLRQSGALPH
jgi:two-component system chemotaxis response regulator CheY